MSRRPKHFKILLNTKGNDPLAIIDELVELAQVARKNGMISLHRTSSSSRWRSCVAIGPKSMWASTHPYRKLP